MNEESVSRLSRDLAASAKTLTPDEARYLVDAYYMMQEDRKRANNQARSLHTSQEPHAVISWLAEQSETLEAQIKRALDKYTDENKVGQWMKGVYGVGPVISAGLLAHIDITRAPTVGHIWRFAGLDPTVKWEKGKVRPWNASLKTLCWKIGQSFMKFSGQEECRYGKIYLERKQYEIARNERGDNAELAKTLIVKFKPTTDAYKHLSTGKLPPAQIDARARRYAVKLFLSHVHEIWRKAEGLDVPLPYPIAILGHAHKIEP